MGITHLTTEPKDCIVLVFPKAFRKTGFSSSYTRCVVLERQVAQVKNRFSLLTPVEWLAKSVIYGSSLITAFLINVMLNMAEPETAEATASFFSWWSTWLGLYLILQGFVILMVTSGRNVGKDALFILDILMSLAPALVLTLAIHGHFDSPERHALSQFDWDIIRPTMLTIMFDVLILGWLGARVSRLMGETHISNQS